jgi:hypothetical protein
MWVVDHKPIYFSKKSLLFGMPFLTCLPYAARKSEGAARVVIKNAKH